ncbi:hypothetical protein AAG906_009866 [Vitis piasezkii]
MPFIPASYPYFFNLTPLVSYPSSFPLPPKSSNYEAMADQENCVRITRAAKKRVAAAMAASDSLQLPPNKKRVVLGELPNSSNAAATLATVPCSRAQKQKFGAKKVKAAMVAAPDVGAKSDDPQMAQNSTLGSFTSTAFNMSATRALAFWALFGFLAGMIFTCFTTTAEAETNHHEASHPRPYSEMS